SCLNRTSSVSRMARQSTRKVARPMFTHRTKLPDKVGVRQPETRRAGRIWPNAIGLRLRPMERHRSRQTPRP
ncbi:hypothetical protein JYG56_23565, partial [Escherichia fergusonii]|nr:hypothetical protein [Escherichia fergusonii]